MSASPPPPPAAASSSQVRRTDNPPVTDGQDHDRMETDEESDESGSEAGEGTPEAGSPGASSADLAQPPPQDDAVMDTSPDNPAVDEPPPMDPPHSPPHASVGVFTNEITGETAQIVQVQVPNPQQTMEGLIAGNIRAVTPADEVRLRAAEREIAAIAPGVTPEERAAMLRAAERELSTVGHIRRIQRAGTGREQLERRERREAREADDEGEGDDDSDDSDSEEENPYWASLKEDTSTPDERELKLIEEMDEVSAVDHEHWEKRVYESLDDPEYVPGEAARIEWVVEGVHGTPEKPNREKIMRSPSTKIGGYYWNIKYFPHGNDGTEQLSIYIECSPRPYEEVETEEAQAKETKDAAASTESPVIGEGSNTVAVAGQIATEDPPTRTPTQDSADENGRNRPATSNVPEAEMEAAPLQNILRSSDKEDVVVEEPWGIAAQISCVIYNPDEPRVNAFQKGCHRFYNDNPDWGWTRFHGPWDEIHKRQRFQRQALLRNDTLAFTAYIRTVKDDTKALWFHPPKEKPEWDTVAMTGIRAFDCQHQSSAMTAALSTWLHLKPIVDLVRRIYVPDPVWEACQRMRPATEELQGILEDDEDSSSGEHQIYLSELMSILNHYGSDVDLNMDVVMIWETLRRVLNFEASGGETIETDVDLFGDFLLLKQPDPFSVEAESNNSSTMPARCPESIKSMLATSYTESSPILRPWQSYAGQPQQIPQRPSVLAIELPRQSFSKDARKWKKLTNRIEIDDTVYYNETQYSLYGMIVHSGDLESKEYYSVIRPEGPGTRWLKFASDHSPRKVEVLTTSQAVHAHEGGGDKADGTAGIAYIVVYVLSESLPDVLCTPFRCKTKQPDHVKESQIPAVSVADAPPDIIDPDQEQIPVYIFNADQFLGYTGRGLCDPWQAQSADGNVREFKFPPKTTIEEIRKYLTEKNADDIDLWPMSTTVPCGRAYPALLPYESHKGDTIEEMGQRSGGCRFWMAPAEPKPVPETDTSLLELQARASVLPEYQEREAVLVAQLSTAEDALAHADPQIGSLGAADNDSEMTEAEAIPEGESQPPPAQQSEVRSEAQHRLEQLQQQLSAHRHMQQQQIQQQVEALTRIQNDHIARIKYNYFLVKIFDAEKTTLEGVTGKVVKTDARISEEVKKLLKVESNEAWDIYHERSTEIQAKDLVKSHESFDSRCGGADGSIFIAQRRPTSAQVAAFESKCQSVNPPEYFSQLHGFDNPTYSRTRRMSSYFARPYENLEQVNGRAHGSGTLVTLSGDAYDGQFVSGTKSGTGEMRYANGDTYVGEWRANEPNGQGTMVYAKTGNKYTGGFKKRKRHGKGTMDFQVADEEMALCKICYEGEMDALFYDCGHVVACEECARQVDVCPVCRRAVRAVVRIWRT
ncbi:hypothetical protein P7C71_g5021, partial [Lecanoromycetidae sp. Uapishka_2]